ncbi:MAG: SufD family Fe-S cluster assembly protein [Candidatus Andersenbacteria bacterium]
MSKTTLQQLSTQPYKYGFSSKIATDTVPVGLNEDIIRMISTKKHEPAWLLEWRLRAFKFWQTLTPPTWQNVEFPAIDYQAIRYYAAPKRRALKSLDQVDPEIRRMFDKLGISLDEQKRISGVAMDAVVDSASVATTFSKELARLGIIFCSLSEAVQKHPDLVRKNLGTVVSFGDNYFASLNAAVFSDGSFCYIPKGVRCPMELSTYFRINSAGTGQFERTLIIAEDDAYVSYLEGCLPGDEEVSCGDQIKTIRDIEVGSDVVNHEGEQAQVGKIMRRGYDGEMFEITPRSPGNAFRITSEHPVLSIKRELVQRSVRPEGRWSDIDQAKLEKTQPTFTPAKDLTEGDLLVFPVNKIEKNDSTLSDDFLKLLGYYIAEGCSTKFNGYNATEFSLGDHEADLIDEVCELIEKITGKRPSCSHDVRKHGMYIVTYDKDLFAKLLEHGGKYALYKKMSKTIMELPPQRQKLLIETYYKGDGSRSKEGSLTRVRAATISRNLAFQMQELLARQGIFAYMNTREAFSERMKDGHFIHHKKRYVLFYAENTRSRRAIRKEDYFLVPIKSVSKKRFRGFVYNFETKQEPHSYLVKGFAVHNCTAPRRDENQLHAAVVELVAKDRAEIKYATVQNWYPGDADGKGGIYNFVTKRGKCQGKNSKISWTQVETGSAITWKYPSVILFGDNSVGEFYSVALTANRQQADTGSKMTHIGKNTRSTIISKGIAAGHGRNTYRGLVRIMSTATGAHNYTQCDSLMLGEHCQATTLPYIEQRNDTSTIEHEASTATIRDEQLVYLRQRGIAEEEAVSMIVNGFGKTVFKRLPLEFAVEARNLLSLRLEGSIA